MELLHASLLEQGGSQISFSGAKEQRKEALSHKRNRSNHGIGSLKWISVQMIST